MNKISWNVTDEAFIDLIASEVRGTLDNRISQELRADDNAEKFHQGLISLKKKIETQLANSRSRAVTKAHQLKSEGAPEQEVEKAHIDHIDWRAKAIRFLGAIEMEITASKHKLREIRSNQDIINDLVEGIFEQMQEIDEDQYTESDERVFKLAKEIRGSH